MSHLTAIFKTVKSIKVSGLPAPALKELQGLLKDSGYMIAVDGIYGPETARAFATFKDSVFQKDPDTLGAGSLGLLRKEAIDRKTGKAPTEAVRAAANVAIAPKENRGPRKRLPSGTSVYVNDPIIPGGSFTWSEFTKGGSRWPVDIYVECQMIKMAQQLEHLKRHCFNVPMIITSAYRPPAVNRAVGGASASRHLHGDAIDLYAAGKSTEWLWSRVRNYWGNRGGQAVSWRGQFVHLDLRGWRAEWVYG